MSRSGWTTTVALVAVAAGAGGYLLGHGADGPPKAPAPAPTRSEPPTAQASGPAVQVVPIEKATIGEALTAYGPVVAVPGEAQAYAAPYEARVMRVRVTGGQVVAAGDALVDLAPSRDTTLQLQKARGEARTARAELALVKKRLGMKLATRQDVSQAEQRAHAAALELNSLRDRGAGAPLTVTADGAGVVSTVSAAQGQLVALGGALVEVVGEEHIAVRLGIESEDIGHVGSGQAVQLAPVGAPSDRLVSGTVRLVTRKVNPDTRLVDVYVAPEAGARLLLDDIVRGRLTVRSAEGLVVPRTAVHPVDGDQILFTVEGGRAHRHVVTIGLQDDTRLQVQGPDLTAGQQAVTVGAAELTDGMAVTVVGAHE